jgi:site-specific recombinase XerD
MRKNQNMPDLSLPFVQNVRDKKTDRVRRYFRKKGYKRVRLAGSPDSPIFKAAYAAAFASAPETPVLLGVPGRHRGGANSIDWLVTSYFNSDAFKLPAEQGGLAEETKAGRRRELERFRAEHGHKSALTIQPNHVRDLMDKVGADLGSAKAAAHPRRNWLKHISGLFNHAVELRLRIDNPCKGFARPKAPKTNGFHSWTDAEIAQYRAYWPLGTVQRLVLEMPLDLSARRTDTTKLGPGHRLDDEVIEFTHNKNGVAVTIPMSPRLLAAIEAMPATNHETFLHTKEGNKRSGKSLGGDFRKWCDEAGLPKRCSLHGLRKACLRLRAEAGSEVIELQSIGGHKTFSELEKYVRDAKKIIAARRGSERLESQLKLVEKGKPKAA